jgi:teichuronic acid exporter
MTETDKPIKTKVISSLFWKLMETGGVQTTQFVVQVVLARLLLPKDYGLIALVQIFILLSNVFVQSGFNTALIQKKDADKLDFSSVFYLSLFVAGILYIILFLTAPFIARFYNESKLVPVLRVLSLTLFFGAVNSIQIAFLSKNMMFKKLFFSSLGAIIASGAVGITTAYLGWGVWALVASQVSNRIIATGVLWFTVKWRPSFLFSLKRVKVLFTYGWKLLVTSLIDTLYNNIRSLFIGKIYSSEMLGYFNRGNQFPALISNLVNGTITSVIFPALSSHQDNIDRVKGMVRRAIVTSSFIIFPIMTGLAVVAEPLIKILLTDK